MMEKVRQRTLRHTRPERGFGHAIAFVLVVVFVVIVVAVVAEVRHHDASIDVAAAARGVGPAVLVVNHNGSGVAISPHEVVTAAHLVDAADAARGDEVVGNGSWSTTASVAGYNRAADIALLELPANSPELTAAAANNSQTVRPGDAVVVLSNSAPTRGTVKATNNNSVTLAAAARDTAIGGPVVDGNDSVVALVRHINGAQVDTLPWNAVLANVDTIDAGHSTAAVHVGPRASLGVTVEPFESSVGARVTATPVGSAAATAGITTGDVIVSVRGVPVSSETDIEAALDPVAPGASVPVAVFDAHGVLHTVSVLLVGA